MLKDLNGELVTCILPGESVPRGLKPVVLPRDTNEVFPKGRHLPYVKDVLDLAMIGLDPDNLGGLVNSDVMPHPQLHHFLSTLPSKVEVVTLHRVELKHKGDPIDSGMRWGKNKSLDGILFRAYTWRSMRIEAPDFVLSEPWWDTGMIRWCTKWRLERESFHGVVHVRHPSSWSFKSAGAKYNAKLWEAVGQ
ncbi:MAG: hypothetical protein ACYTBJ_00190 [Planctomycetota bacterium]|jgi:hypothetical protein